MQTDKGANNQKFKVGDRVVARNYPLPNSSSYGTVVGVWGDLVYCRDWSAGVGAAFLSIGARSIELLPPHEDPKSARYIIIPDGPEDYRASVEFGSLSEAAGTARLLANSHRGTRFKVCRLVPVSSFFGEVPEAPKPVVKTVYDAV